MSKLHLAKDLVISNSSSTGNTTPPMKKISFIPMHHLIGTDQSSSPENEMHTYFNIVTLSQLSITLWFLNQLKNEINNK
jgi:hypothetical protein